MARALSAAQQRPQGRQQPPWSHPAAVPAHRPTPDAPQPAPRPAEQAAAAIAALRHVRAPAAVLESALHLTQALLKQPCADPLLLEAAEGLAAVIPQYLAAARTPAPTPPAARLRTVPSPTTGGTGTLAG
ncbi:hypothetical protein AB0D10_43770 [Kitasatospora sp. NPDC048545]|uniref:hypothetical protein n=1 Tax=Kitasatospora sp. NPDC048545 TaxID=3157208 RepID=UPI0033CD7C4C